MSRVRTLHRTLAHARRNVYVQIDAMSSGPERRAPVRVPFTVEMRDFLLETARTDDPDELGDVVRRRVGLSPSDIIDPPRKN